MELSKPLNIFYSEPDPDRWFIFDRYPRRLIRRLIRGKQKPGGVMMVALNLMQGLDKIGVSYRFNDYKYIKKHPEEIACIIGKPHLLLKKSWDNPIIFGPGIFSHPSDWPDLLERFPKIKYLLVPGYWMKEMFTPFYGSKVLAWPAGIDTEQWKPSSKEKNIDFLIYDKIRWERDKYLPVLLEPILSTLRKKSLTYKIIRYGSYLPVDLKIALAHSKAALFLCEHETQGLAYQQILSANVPILAWDRSGHWLDPSYYPTIKFGPVSSVPYWDNTCGIKFTSIEDFKVKLDAFITSVETNMFKPRNYILDNLSLEKCAGAYVQMVSSV